MMHPERVIWNLDFNSLTDPFAAVRMSTIMVVKLVVANYHHSANGQQTEASRTNSKRLKRSLKPLFHFLVLHTELPSHKKCHPQQFSFILSQSALPFFFLGAFKAVFFNYAPSTYAGLYLLSSPAQGTQDLSRGFSRAQGDCPWQQFLLLCQRMLTSPADVL